MFLYTYPSIQVISLHKNKLDLAMNRLARPKEYTNIEKYRHFTYDSVNNAYYMSQLGMHVTLWLNMGICPSPLNDGFNESWGVSLS